MAYMAIREVDALDPELVLAPERYDPRRSPNLLDSDPAGGRRLPEFASIVRTTLAPQKADPGSSYLVFDTGNARDGFLSVTRQPVSANSIGSAKKLLEVGDVIVSRLRPYLRQVAWVDPGIATAQERRPPIAVASTEFYVLRSVSSQSITFLVPFLLSVGVQSILAASQEGGHHPRFPEKTLCQLLVPSTVVDRRDEVSRMTEEAVNKARASEALLRAVVKRVEAL